jgi:DNA-binding LacI/PurR family transcriptional regulator
MAAKKSKQRRSVDRPVNESDKPVTLKDVAEYLSLSPATVSLVINRSPAADSIPKTTHDRVFAAAKELDYRPNYLARSLRSKRSFSVGVLVREISEAYAAGVMSGIEDHLIGAGYFYMAASHRLKPDLLKEYINLLRDRLVEGFILVATPIDEAPPLPTVSVAGHKTLDRVTNVVIDHDHAAHQALGHLVELGHQRIAFFKGQPESADTEDRWQAILRAADSLGVEVKPELTLQLETLQLETDPSGGEEGYQEAYAFGQELLARKCPFTSLFAFNDVSAIGAMRAFLDAGLKVPTDVSVVGFDDIQSSAFQNPSLTTVRQPLREMGVMAGRILLERLAGTQTYPDFVTVEPQLVVRASTGPPPDPRRSSL